MKKGKVLLVEDDQNTRNQLKWAFSDGYKVFLAEDRENSINIFQNENPQIVLLDLSLSAYEEGEVEGLIILDKMINLNPKVKIIVVTANEDEKNALKAIRMGAYDYYLKPVNIDELKLIVKRAFRGEKSKKFNKRSIRK